jgi:iron-sulfur cluster repair protein YtfE (RIC family)
MEITELLRNDHRTVRSLIHRFGEHEGEARDEIVTELLDELEVHAQLEEDLFYPVIRAEIPDAAELVAEGMEEHHVAKELIGEIRGLDPEDEAWEAKVKVLGENVEHHIEEEEEELFPKVHEGLDEERRRQMADEVREAKKRIRFESMTVIDLREHARDAGVAGASSMKKSELIEAMTEAASGASNVQ